MDHFAQLWWHRDATDQSVGYSFVTGEQAVCNASESVENLSANTDGMAPFALIARPPDVRKHVYKPSYHNSVDRHYVRAMPFSPVSTDNTTIIIDAVAFALGDTYKLTCIKISDLDSPVEGK